MKRWYYRLFHLLFCRCLSTGLNRHLRCLKSSSRTCHFSWCDSYLLLCLSHMYYLYMQKIIYVCVTTINNIIIKQNGHMFPLTPTHIRLKCWVSKQNKKLEHSRWVFMLWRERTETARHGGEYGSIGVQRVSSSPVSPIPRRCELFHCAPPRNGPGHHVLFGSEGHHLVYGRLQGLAAHYKLNGALLEARLR